MKIALATWFPKDPSAPCGGVEAVSVNLIRALARIAGTEIHVVTFDQGIGAPESLRWEGARVLRLPRAPGSMLAFACGEGRRRLGEYFNELGPDVVHAHDTFGIMTRGLDLPRVFTIHGFIHEDTRLRGGWKDWLHAGLWKREELTTWAEQPHIISISPYVRERLRGIAHGVIHDIENPIDDACYHPRLIEEPGQIFSAAVICRRKNQLALVNAIAELDAGSGVKLRLAGPIGEADYRDHLLATIKDRGLAGQVEFLGNLSAPEVREEMAKAAVFALTSLEEGAPMVIAEAMAAGIPVLASNRCGMPYMIRHGETGRLVDPNSIRDIVRNLKLLLTDSSLRNLLGETARVRALETFQSDRVAQRTVAVYETILSESSS